MNDKLPYPIPELLCWSDETRFLPSGSDAAVMWASGLGSTQTTPKHQHPSRSRAKFELQEESKGVSAWLDLLTNPVMERFYDC